MIRMLTKEIQRWHTQRLVACITECSSEFDCRFLQIFYMIFQHHWIFAIFFHSFLLLKIAVRLKCVRSVRNSPLFLTCFVESYSFWNTCKKYSRTDERFGPFSTARQFSTCNGDWSFSWAITCNIWDSKFGGAVLSLRSPVSACNHNCGWFAPNFLHMFNRLL